MEDSLIKEAEKLLQFAWVELKEAEESQDLNRGRQVCEKAYLSLLKATNVLLIKKGITAAELPKTDRGRFFLLKKLATPQQRNTFHSLRDILHIDGFHEGIVDLEDLKEQLNRVKNYLEEIKSS